MAQDGDRETWVRDLDGGAKAVALFNRGADAAKMSVKWKDLGVKGKARDLWAHAAVSGGGHPLEMPAAGDWHRHRGVTGDGRGEARGPASAS